MEKRQKVLIRRRNKDYSKEKYPKKNFKEKIKSRAQKRFSEKL